MPFKKREVVKGERRKGSKEKGGSQEEDCLGLGKPKGMSRPS